MLYKISYVNSCGGEWELTKFLWKTTSLYTKTNQFLVKSKFPNEAEQRFFRVFALRRHLSPVAANRNNRIRLGKTDRQKGNKFEFICSRL